MSAVFLGAWAALAAAGCADNGPVEAVAPTPSPARGRSEKQPHVMEGRGVTRGKLLLALAVFLNGCADLPLLVQAAAQQSVPAAQSVTLRPGNNFQAANDAHPPGTVFTVAAGVHRRQRVFNPQSGNRWVGEEGAVLDGENARGEAFAGHAENILIRGLALRNYRDNGIAFRGGGGVRVEAVHISDTGSGDGESNGAVRFFGMSDIEVTRCRFERVSSGVLPTECAGPIRIEHNVGVNTGRNFVQLDKCLGGGIRVRYNSMERVGAYLRPGAEDVEDWISVYKVRGLADDPAQFSYNRARGHGVSGSGSFIMLGDGGGVHQEAVGNVGVTPGQVGIGLSGGERITVRGNRMFSESWAQSNIAFYSSNYAKTFPCGDHVVRGNSANWTNRDGRQNTFWTNDTCQPLEAADNAFPDEGLDEKIWEAWEAAYGAPGP